MAVRVTQGVDVPVLAKLAILAHKYPRRILLVAVGLLVACAAYGAPAMWSLPGGGQETPGTESMRANAFLESHFEAGGSPIFFTVTSDAGADSVAARERGREIVAQLKKSPFARQVISYWTVPPQMNGSLVSQDGTTGLVAARIVGDDRQAPERAAALAEPLLGEREGVRVQAGGEALAYNTGTVVSREDLLVMEAIAIPFTFLVLVWAFGSIVASVIPLLVAITAIAGTTAALWSLHTVTQVSIFALNVATALGLALAIDYTLFIVSRYREERQGGSSERDALVRTMMTAGKTVTYSALVMAATLSTLLIFPQYLLQSLGYAGVLVVVLALIASLTVAPALIVILGPRIDALDIRKPIRRRFGRRTTPSADPEQQFWYRLAVRSMQHAPAVAVICVAVLLLLSSPLLGVNFGSPDDRDTPSSSSPHAAGQILRSGFPQQNHAGTVRVVLPSGLKSPAQVADYAARLSLVAGVTTVAGPNGMYRHGTPINAGTYDAVMRGDSAYISIGTTFDPSDRRAQEQLSALRAVDAPAPAYFAGLTQRNIDNVNGVATRIPTAIALVAIITFILMFLMTGSVVLPIKAVIMNVLALGAAFGVMIWIIQDGNLGGAGTTWTGQTTVFIPPLMACIAYALAMDYEIFVLARIREFWLQSGRTKDDNARAVALGLAYTGRIVTAAAVVMLIVFIAIAASRVSFMRGLGIGLSIGVIVDAFIVRTILVPAVMRLAGRFNWWAPGPLRRFHDRWGLTETQAGATAPDIAVGAARLTPSTTNHSNEPHRQGLAECHEAPPDPTPPRPLSAGR